MLFLCVVQLITLTVVLEGIGIDMSCCSFYLHPLQNCKVPNCLSQSLPPNHTPNTTPQKVHPGVYVHKIIQYYMIQSA